MNQPQRLCMALSIGFANGQTWHDWPDDGPNWEANEVRAWADRYYVDGGSEAETVYLTAFAAGLRVQDYKWASFRALNAALRECYEIADTWLEATDR